MDKIFKPLGKDWHETGASPKVNVKQHVRHISCWEGGVISFVHPSKPLENENNFEIWGDVGGKVCPRFEYFVHLRYVHS